MNNIYGTKRPANITPDDVEIFYYYRPNRSEEDNTFGSVFKTLSAYSVLSKSKAEVNGNEITLPGMYNLSLPLREFSKKGIYTIYIKPKEIKTTINDVASLFSYPSTKGIVIKKTGLSDSITTNGGLVGYRVEYINSDGERESDFRIITSSNYACPTNTGNGVSYIFNDNSDLIFCTVTPSTSNSFKSNSIPYIGEKGKEIVLVNTKFNPVCLEIEMVEHDDETISWMLEGDQIINREKGIITTFTGDGDIYHQSQTGRITDVENGSAHDVRFKAEDNIDFSEKDKIVDLKSEFGRS